MIILNYTKLFTIEFLHDAFSDKTDIMNSLTLFPDSGTCGFMAGNRIYCKTQNNTLFFYTQTPATIEKINGNIRFSTLNKPLIRVDETASLCYKIQLRGERFFNDFNLCTLESTGKFFLFKNDSGNTQNLNHYLSRQIPEYNAAETYKPGMLVKDSGGTCLKLRESAPGNEQSTANNSYWKMVTGTFQYVNQKDLVNNPEDERCFAAIKICFRKDLPGDFSLLRKSNDPVENDTILKKDYVIRFKQKETNGN